MPNSHPQRPPRYKLALLTWAGAYAVVPTMTRVFHGWLTPVAPAASAPREDDSPTG